MENKNWTKVEINGRSGKLRITKARIERIDLPTATRWAVNTVGGLTIGGWKNTEAEAQALLDSITAA